LTEISDIVKGCRAGKREAQQALYERYSELLFGICLRYIASRDDAEDVLMESFYKIFQKITDFREEGSFEGWMKRIVVNDCLMFLRKRSNTYLTVELGSLEIADDTDEEIDLPFSFEQINTLLEKLPTGYRTVFNLYVFEALKHREIAALLGISIHTSKSQYTLAKNRIISILASSKDGSIKLTSNDRK
jgi:RNA polymerase sigma-70 factor (ECF subfamily)